MFSGKSKLKRDHEKKSNYFTFHIKQVIATIKYFYIKFSGIAKW